LAHGHCKCRRDTGRKGVPRCFVPWVDEGENVDLFPEGFLVERGCEISRGAKQQLTTPKGRIITILLWGTLPYIMKDDLNRILGDLPEIEVHGRSGQPARNPTAARVLRTHVASKMIRQQLHHLHEAYDKKRVQYIQTKYRKLPDQYYGEKLDEITTPSKFVKETAGLFIRTIVLLSNFGNGSADLHLCQLMRKITVFRICLR